MLYYDHDASAQQRLEQFVTDSFRPGAALPFSFCYKGVSSRDFLPTWVFARSEEGIAFRGPDGLTVRVEIRRFPDFPAVEWLLRLENASEEESGLIEDVNAMDMVVEASPFRTAGTQQYGALDNILYYNGGSDCKADDFIPCQEILHYISARKEMDFGCAEGRPTSGSHGSFPYFHMKTLDQGVFFAIGWSGQWHMKLRTRQRETPDGKTGFRFTGGMPGIATRLHPGEQIRTARILLMPWQGTVEDARNQSRRFLLKYHTPQIGGKPAVLPLSLQSWGYSAQRNMAEIDTGVRSGLPLDTFWVDAGWYGPAGTHCDDPFSWDWSDHVGWYSHDPSRYPEGLGQVADHAHRAGMRFLLWMEPDRAVVGTPCQTQYPEHYLEYDLDHSRMLDLGREDAYQWALAMLSEKIETYHLDVLRIDYNVGPLEAWDHHDEEGRRGMTQIRAVENFYRLWGELRRRFPHLLIDNCASGGRRLDFEANTYSVSLFRTDYLCYADCGPAGMQVQTGGMAPFVPLNGLVFTGETNWYNFVSCLAAAFAITPERLASAMETPERFAAFSHMIDVLARVRTMITGDFYPLTSITFNEQDWYAYQVNCPEKGEGYVVSARRAECPMLAASYRLRHLEADATYQLEDAETGRMLGRYTGRSLAEGLEVHLPQPETASLIFYTRV